MTASKIIEPIIKNYVENNFNCSVIKMSFNLGNREELRKDLEKNGGYDTILTELKAASVDVLTDYAFKHKKEIIYMNNIPIVIGGNKLLEKELKNIFSKEKD
ncbi:Cyclic 2,3-diphosphoglycerate synthetase [subsurface metagenome]